MKLEHQTDGTYLASQVIGNRLKLSEGRNSDEAWHGLIEMITDDYKARWKQIKSEVAA